jgi:hypothetical protein
VRRMPNTKPTATPIPPLFVLFAIVRLSFKRHSEPCVAWRRNLLCQSQALSISRADCFVPRSDEYYLLFLLFNFDF